MITPCFRYFGVLVVLWLFVQCKPEPKLAQWDNDVSTPMIESRIDLRDLVPDSNLTTDPDGLLSFIFRHSLADWKPDEVIKPLNADFVNNIKLQSIDLGERKFTDFISLGDLSKGGDPAGQFIIFNNGNNAIVPPFPNVGPKNFDVNASSLFQSITLQEGEVTLSFDNELPVALTNVDFRLENKSDGTVILQSFIDTIPAQQKISEVFDLTNITIDGQMRAVLQNFSSPGSDTNTVVIDTSDRLYVEILLKDLVPTAATAIFPEQTLARDTAYSDPIQAGQSELTAIRVDQGRIYLDATSTVEDEITLEYIVPSATRNGQPLRFTEVLPPAPSGGVSQRYVEVDLSGYRVDLTGQPGDVGVFNQFYTILNGRIDSSGRLISLSLNDSLTLKTGIIDLTADYGEGYLGPDLLEIAQTNQIDFFEVIDSGNFSLAQAKLSLHINNYIGAPVSVSLQQLQARANGSSQNLNWNLLGQPLPVAAAQDGNNPRPTPGTLSIELDENNSNINELLSLPPGSFHTQITGLLNATTTSPDYQQFIYAQYGVKANLQLVVPLELSAQGLSFSDSSLFDYSSWDAKDRLQQLTLRLFGKNHFPLSARVEMHLINDAGELTGKLQSTGRLQAGETDGQGRVTALRESHVDYPLSPEQLVSFKEAHQIIFKVSLDSPVPPVMVKIYDHDYLDLQLAADMKIRQN